MNGLYAVGALLLSFAATTVLVLVGLITARRMLLDIARYQGRQMLLASAAIGTITVLMILLVVRQLAGHQWLDIPLATTLASGVLVMWWASRVKL